MIKRTHYLINKPMQFKLILQFVIFIMIFASFIVFELYITVWPVVSPYIPQSLSDLVISKVIFRLLCFSIPILFVLVGFILIFSNRIAGPIYRLEKTLDKLIAGEDVEIIELRKRDDLKTLISKINDVILYIKNLKDK